jgi:hypothetical protein
MRSFMICNHKRNLGDKINNNERAGRVARMEEKSVAHKVLVVKTQGKRPLGKLGVGG